MQNAASLRGYTHRMGYTYRPLQGNEIRLIRLSTEVIKRSEVSRLFRPSLPTKDGSEISVCVDHVDLDSDPVYFALSYAWGNAENQKLIVVDGSLFEVTDNLLTALRQIKGHIYEFSEITRTKSGNPDSDF